MDKKKKKKRRTARTSKRRPGRPRQVSVEEEEEEDNEEYEVKVLRTRVVNGVEESLVHWVGYGSQYDEWKPSSEISLHQEENEEEEPAEPTKKKAKENGKEKEKEDGAQVLVADSQNGREQEERKAKKRARSRKGKEKVADDEEEEEEEDDDKDKDKDYEDVSRKKNQKKRRSWKRKESEDEDEEEEEEERPRKMMWTAEELAQLEEAAEEASTPGAVSWVQVAAQLGNRTPKSCKRRWQRLQTCHAYYKSPKELEQREKMINKSRLRPWTEAEETRLLKEVAKQGLHYDSDLWMALESKFKRSAGALQLRWSELHGKRGAAVELDSEAASDFDDNDDNEKEKKKKKKKKKEKKETRRRLAFQSSQEVDASQGGSDREPAAAAEGEQEPERAREAKKGRGGGEEENSEGDDAEKSSEGKAGEVQRGPTGQKSPSYRRKQRRPSSSGGGQRMSYALSRVADPLGASQEATAADRSPDAAHEKPRMRGRNSEAEAEGGEEEAEEEEERQRKQPSKKKGRKKKGAKKRAKRDGEEEGEEEEADGSPYISLDEMDSPLRREPEPDFVAAATAEADDHGMPVDLGVAAGDDKSQRMAAEDDTIEMGEAPGQDDVGQGMGLEENENEEDKDEEEGHSDGIEELDFPPRRSPAKKKKKKAKSRGSEEEEGGEGEDSAERAKRKEWEKRQAERLHAWVERQRELNLQKYGQRTFSPRLAGRRRTIAGEQLRQQYSPAPQPAEALDSHHSNSDRIDDDAGQRKRRRTTTTSNVPQEADERAAAEAEEGEVDDFLMGKRPTTGKRRRRASSPGPDAGEHEGRESKRARRAEAADEEWTIVDLGVEEGESREAEAVAGKEAAEALEVSAEEEMERKTIATFERIARERREALEERITAAADHGDAPGEKEETEIIARIESVIARRKKAVVDRRLRKPPPPSTDSEWQVVFGDEQAAAREVNSAGAAVEPLEEPMTREAQDEQRERAERDVIGDIERAVRRQRRKSVQAEHLREQREREAAAEAEQQREAQAEVREQTVKLERLLTKKRRESMVALRGKQNRAAIASAVRRRHASLGGAVFGGSTVDVDEARGEAEEEEEEEDLNRTVDELKDLVERQRRELEVKKQKRAEEERRREEERRMREAEERQRIDQVHRYWHALHQRG